MKNLTHWAFLLLLLGLFSCGKNEDDKKKDDRAKDREKMLTEYADNFVIPSYEDLNSKMGQLFTLTEQFVAVPNAANYQALKTQGFEPAYLCFQKANVAEFGPSENSVRSFLNTYPVTVSKVNANISAGTYNLDAFGNADAQGFPALDFLLNGEATELENIARFTTDVDAANRKQYLLDVVHQMKSKVTAALNNWQSNKVAFIAKYGTDASSSTSNLINNTVLYYEKYLRAGKVGLPVGAMTGNAALQLVEAKYSPQLTNALLETAVRSFKDFYEGRSYNGSASNSISLKSYLKAVGTKDNAGILTGDLISSKLDNVLIKISGLSAPLASEIVNDRPKVLQLYDELQSIVPLLKVDMVSAFGVSITYVDNDGD